MRVQDSSVSTNEIRLEIGAPLALPAGARAWKIAAGRVEFHLQWSGGRRFLASRSGGEMAFGLPAQADAALMMVALEPVTLQPAEEDRDADGGAALVEQAASWVLALTEALPPDPEDGSVKRLDPGCNSVEPGDILLSRDPVWVEPRQTALHLGASDEPPPGGFVLGGAIRAVAAGTGQVDICPLSPDQPLATALGAMMAQLPERFERAAGQEDTRTLRRLGALEAQDGMPTRPELARALEHAASVLDVEIALPTHGLEEMKRLPELARIAGLRARKVALARDWFARGGTPLIVRDDRLGRVEALSWERGAYRGADGRHARFADLARDAYAISAPLPENVTGLWSMARFALAGNARDLITVAAAAACVALLGVLTPLATAWLLTDIVPSGLQGLLISVGAALVIAAFVSAVLGAARAIAMTRIDGRGAIALADGLLDRLLKLPTAFFKDFSAGDLNQRLENVDQIRQLAVSVVLSAGLTAALSVVYFGVLLLYDTRLALIGIALVTVYILAVILARLLQLGAIREAARLDGAISGLVYETLEGVPKLRSAAAEARAMERWRALYLKEREAAVRAGRVGVHFSAFAATYQTMSMLALFAAAALLVQRDLPAGVFIGFLSAFGAFQSAFVQLSEALLQVYSAQPLIERAQPILQARPESERGRADPGVLQGAIEMSGVTFAYESGLAPILDGASFRVNPGEHLAIVGPSGSGKSTILRLLLGFETPRRGSITYDGQDLSQLDLARVRAQIGVVLQASQLFAGSILDNIRGARDASLEDCLEAAEMTGLARDLGYFAMGIHTPITEGATTLSGGQRQRILIARALVGRPKIMFFDEATSALDNATQAVVSQTLDALQASRITIAHRLSTVRNADRICVLSGGKFIESGNFAELMAANGAFRRLAERQLTEE